MHDSGLGQKYGPGKYQMFDGTVRSGIGARGVVGLCFSRGWSVFSLPFTPYLFIFIGY